MAEESKNQDDAMLGLIATYLQANGWNVVVIGDARVQKPADGREFNYEFVVRFTGSKRKEGGDDANG